MAKKKKPRNPHRPASSYISKDPDARERSLANLTKSGRRHGEYVPDKNPKAPLPPPLDDPAYATDIIKFAEEQFFVRIHWDAKAPNAETGRPGAWVNWRKPIVLLPWQKDELLRPVFYADLRPTLALWLETKKSGKSALAALVCAWVLYTQDHGQEIYLASKAKLQAKSVIFRQLRSAVRMNPRFAAITEMRTTRLEVESRDCTLECVGVDTAIAGRNPSLTVFDELWTYEHEYLRTFYDELTTVPTRASPLTLIVSYPGTNRDCLLGDVCEQGEDKQKAVAAGKPDPDPRMHFHWSHENRCPWQTPEYLATQKKRQRRSTYLRLHEARWTAGEEAFCTAEELDRCTGSVMRGVPAGQELYVGIDLGTKHDCAAVVAVSPCEWNGKPAIRLVEHAMWVPEGNAHLDLGEVIELVKWLHAIHSVMDVGYDPYQMVRIAQELEAVGLPMTEFRQTVDKLVSMHGTLHEYVQDGQLLLYRDADVRTHILNAHVKEHPQGWRLVKRTARRKIDLAIALAMAVQGCAEAMTEGAPVVTAWEGEGRQYPFATHDQAVAAWMRDEI